MAKGFHADGTPVNRLSEQDFIARANLMHANKYNYSQAKYAGQACKVIIICPSHGCFQQTPNDHLAGCGCPKCAGNNLKLTTQDFVSRARLIHGDKYDYSSAVYSKIRDKLIIICPSHGSFQQDASSHLNGRGCRACAGNNYLCTKEEFIAKAQGIHGGKYDYSGVVYNGNKKEVLITCPRHGQFKQVVAIHLRGSGCPICGAITQRATWIEAAAGALCTLYFLRLFNKSEEFYKVGITYQSLKLRYRGGKATAYYTYEVLAQHQSRNALAIYDWEQSILETFSHLRYRPKKHFNGYSECFSSCEEILSIFPL